MSIEIFYDVDSEVLEVFKNSQWKLSDKLLDKQFSFTT